MFLKSGRSVEVVLIVDDYKCYWWPPDLLLSDPVKSSFAPTVKKDQHLMARLDFSSQRQSIAVTVWLFFYTDFHILNVCYIEVQISVILHNEEGNLKFIACFTAVLQVNHWMMLWTRYSKDISLSWPCGATNHGFGGCGDDTRYFILTQGRKIYNVTWDSNLIKEWEGNPTFTVGAIALLTQVSSIYSDHLIPPLPIHISISLSHSLTSPLTGQG